MPGKKKKYNARFPPARIKKIMQTDEDVGKVAAAVPVIISRALELFIDSLIEKTASVTRGKNAKTLSASHIKQAIHSEKTFDFLRDLVQNVPDHQADDEGEGPGPVASCSVVPEKKIRVPRVKKEGSRGPGRPRKVKQEERLEQKSESDEQTESDDGGTCDSESNSPQPSYESPSQSSAPANSAPFQLQQQMELLKSMQQCSETQVSSGQSSLPLTPSAYTSSSQPIRREPSPRLSYPPQLPQQYPPSTYPLPHMHFPPFSPYPLGVMPGLPGLPKTTSTFVPPSNAGMLAFSPGFMPAPHPRFMMPTMGMMMPDGHRTSPSMVPPSTFAQDPDDGNQPLDMTMSSKHRSQEDHSSLPANAVTSAHASSQRSLGMTPIGSSVSLPMGITTPMMGMSPFLQPSMPWSTEINVSSNAMDLPESVQRSATSLPERKRSISMESAVKSSNGSSAVQILRDYSEKFSEQTSGNANLNQTSPNNMVANHVKENGKTSINFVDSKSLPVKGGGSNSQSVQQDSKGLSFRRLAEFATAPNLKSHANVDEDYDA
ncbi:hypothetical protein DPMN_098087 [Dreissena polymorpha]|uniref:Dr1-associated corepressor n=2 Tax=Dreissena polymorpha TaxID=45954 RepID=A0A9D4LCW9_DREPO|nr:hypothetical protein DPMN_098050 [Dreissena polymorpha]KAH3855519.1 hypothetical protein DPMN_098087 [Dreissena polymorpha]